MGDDGSELTLSKREVQVSDHYLVEDFELSDEMEERYSEEPEAVMKEVLENHGYSVRGVEIRGNAEQFRSGEVFCYKHVKSPPDAESYWELYPCQATSIGRTPDRLEDLYQKIRATVAIWTSPSDPRYPRPGRDPSE